MAGKGGPNNTQFTKGLVPIAPKIYLEPEVLAALKAIAAKDDRSINRTIARMIREATQFYRDDQAQEEADAASTFSYADEWLREHGAKKPTPEQVENFTRGLLILGTDGTPL